MIKIEGFTNVSSLDMYVRYYHINLLPGAKHLCTIVFLWGEYQCQKLPMGVCNSPNCWAAVEIGRTKCRRSIEGIRRIKCLRIYDDLEVIQIVEHIHQKFNEAYAVLRIYDDLEVIQIVEYIYRKFMHVKHMPSICRTTHLGLSRS